MNSGVVRRKKNEIYVPNPVLGHVLTMLFFVLIAFVLWALYDEGRASNEAISPIATFGVCLVACSLLIWLCKLSSTLVAQLLNRLLVWAGFVDKAPISGRAQMKKLQDQSWQLVIHVSMAAFEVYLLNVDCPGLWSDSSLAWVPSPFGDYKPSTILKRFYLFQLV